MNKKERLCGEDIVSMYKTKGEIRGKDMKEIGVYIIFILFITILIPFGLVKGCDGIEDKDEPVKRIELEENNDALKIYNSKTNEIEEIEIEEYIKGVVAAEMPAAFDIEALKAQAVAARTYAVSRIERFGDGHPDHPQSPLCTGIHCQAWLSLDELKQAHGDKWVNEYWPKIREAVDSTKGEVLMFDEELIEPLFHSTSGGMTEDSEDVFVSAKPYLRAVESPYEEDAPKFKDSMTMSFNDFVKKVNSKYPNTNITKSNITQMIKVAEKSETGRIKQLMIGDDLVSGRDFRTLFNLNSTNFKINMIGDQIQIETIGNGHGVGMSQWGANGMAKNGSSYEQILKHYYTGVEIENIDEK